MDRLFWEELQSAVRNLCFFSRVSLTSVVFSLVWHNHLNVTLRAQGSTLKQRYFVLNTPLVDILSGPYVIEGICNECPALEELIRVEIFSLLTHFVQFGNDFAFELRVQLEQCRACSRRLCLFHVFFPEEELSREVGSFDVVGVGD